ncbi:SH3 domain-containing protein [Aureisphaera galaxeae]|uniref:SH3 domain-containing protein n=1 Tax=Aureisphaera galaxeae TaxID=1538023 RepID=UPI002350089D|nr:SH3 domain-containing protein [Aureisphaera galaxeae]MDC8006145.1 SH3 domain-containing protein [Aureisphaera galaxeae]
MKATTSILLLLLSSTFLFGQDTSFVLAENGLIVRKSPDQKSERIGKLLYGAEVEILDETGIELQIRDGEKSIKGEWFKIKEVDGINKGYVFSAYLVDDKLFTLDDPDIEKLKKQIAISDQNTEVIYNYLINNYKPLGEKSELEYYEWDNKMLCSFSQEFEPGIKYSIFECKEAGGTTVELKLPRINRKKLMKWVEQIYEVGKMDIDQNVWKENNTKFEPKKTNPGCYFKIEEKGQATLVELYCGC